MLEEFEEEVTIDLPGAGSEQSREPESFDGSVRGARADAEVGGEDEVGCLRCLGEPKEEDGIVRVEGSWFWHGRLDFLCSRIVNMII